jgi:carboxyl-terminal processing protease
MKRPIVFSGAIWTLVAALVLLMAITGRCGAPGAGAAQNKPEETVDAHPFDAAHCFDEVWATIKDGFWDPHFQGVDWDEAKSRYRPRALGAPDHEAFAAVVNQMLAELRTSHTHYYTRWDPDYYSLQAVFVSQSLAGYGTSDPSVLEQRKPGLYSSDGRPQRAGIGVATKLIEGRHYVSYVFAGSPAEKAGIVLGDWLVQVDGKPFHPIRSFDGQAGRTLEILVQNGPAESTRRLVRLEPIVREERVLFEGDSEARTRIIEHRGHRIAYTRLCWLSGWNIRNTFDQCLGESRASDGVIIDIRDGFGGAPPEEFIDPFLRKGLEDVTTAFIKGNRKLEAKLVCDGPIVLLINQGSRSGKEVLAYYFKKTGLATLLGEQTAGCVSVGRWKRISRDSMLYYAAYKMLIDEKSLESVGVEPDIVVPFDIRFAGGRDIQLERAKDEIVRQIEKNKVQ